MLQGLPYSVVWNPDRFRGYRIAWFGTLIASGATAQTAFWVVWAVVLPVSLILADFGRLIFPFVPPGRRKMSAGR